MVNRHWKPYMLIDYQDNGMKLPALCLLSAIDFDAEMLTLTPIDEFYNRDEFHANLKYCSIPKRMRAATIEGKIQKDPADNFIKGKKCP